MNATAEKLDSPLENEALMPVQYADLLRGGEERPPEHRLLFAVLEDAVRSWQVHSRCVSARDRRLFREDAEWFASDDDSSPFSFVAICHLFRLDPEYLRTGLARWREHQMERGIKAEPFRLRRAGGLRHSVTAARERRRVRAAG